MQPSLGGTIALALGGTGGASPSVAIHQGTVTGGLCSGNANAAYFKSIPYAESPVGALRFQPPQALEKFPTGSIDGTQAAPACIQFADEFKETGATSEDCLYIDVWAPANATASSGLPVRVWLYGGGNQDGGISDPLYDGCNLVSTDALLVNINYRLGPLGYLSLTDAGIGGNQGIQDALLGLQWVQDNIEAFGGDLDKVMLHGQSAGAQDAWTIATLPQAPKLMSSAIFESGAGRSAPLQPTVERISSQYASQLNCSTSDATCLQDKSVEDLTSTYTSLPLLNDHKLPALSIGNISTPSFAPCVDGKVIPKQPSTEGTKVPSIFGATSLEGTLFALAEYASSPNGPVDATAADYEQFLHENFGPAAATIEKYYPLSAFNSTPYPPFFAMAVVLTDASYFCPARRGLVTTAAAGIPAWTYLFQHRPSCIWIPGIPEEAVQLLGPAHTAEIPFVFGHTSDLPSPNGTCAMTEDEKKISSFLSSAWTAMAAHQQPADASQWPQWGNAEKSLGINILNTTIPGYVNYTACELWDKIAQLPLSGNGTGGSGSGLGGGPGASSSSSGNGSSPSVAPPKPTTSSGIATGGSSVRIPDIVLALSMALVLVLFH